MIIVFRYTMLKLTKQLQMYHRYETEADSSRHISSQKIHINKTRELVVGIYKACSLTMLTGWVRQASQQCQWLRPKDMPASTAKVFAAATNRTNETKEGSLVGSISNLLK
jgi:hypothetical protein